jgi:hypothetical protein
MTKIFSLLALALTVACGGVDNGELFDEADAGDELGSVEQAISAKPTPSFQFGSLTATNRRKPNRTSSGQVVTVPTTVNLKVCTNPRSGAQLSTASKLRAEAMRSELHDGHPTWSFNFPQSQVGVIDGACEFDDGVPGDSGGFDANILVNKGSVGASGTSSNNIEDYASVQFIRGNGSDNLSEGAGVAGNYKSHQFCAITIDETDLLAKGTNAAQDQNLIDHAIINSYLVCAGTGRHPTATSTSQLYSRRFMNASIDVGTMSDGEFCMSQSYALSNLGAFTLTSPACTND